jgi:hypothetical protein
MCPEVRAADLSDALRGDEVAHVVSRITEDPMPWLEREGGYRQVNWPVFP